MELWRNKMIYDNIKLNIINGDITELEIDAIVNPANNSLLGGGGVDGAIHKKGGGKILDQCKKIGGCPTGEAVITTGGNLRSNYVIHTVGPVYKDGDKLARKFLYRAYYNSLLLAKEYNLSSIGFPSISTGAYGYPIGEAVEIVAGALNDFDKNENYKIDLSLVLFSQADYELYKKHFKFFS